MYTCRPRFPRVFLLPVIADVLSLALRSDDGDLFLGHPISIGIPRKKVTDRELQFAGRASICANPRFPDAEFMDHVAGLESTTV